MSPALVRFSKYSIVGGSTFAFDLVLLYILIDWLYVTPVLAAGGAFLVAVSLNYVLSRRFVFRGTLRGVHAGYANFLIIAGTGLFIVTGGMYLFSTILAWHYIVARIAVALITGFWSYLMNLYVNFKVVGKHE